MYNYLLISSWHFFVRERMKRGGPWNDTIRANQDHIFWGNGDRRVGWHPFFLSGTATREVTYGLGWHRNQERTPGVTQPTQQRLQIKSGSVRFESNKGAARAPLVLDRAYKPSKQFASLPTWGEGRLSKSFAQDGSENGLERQTKGTQNASSSIRRRLIMWETNQEAHWLCQMAWHVCICKGMCTWRCHVVAHNFALVKFCRLLHHCHDWESSAFLRIESLPAGWWLPVFQLSRHGPGQCADKCIGIMKRKRMHLFYPQKEW